MNFGFGFMGERSLGVARDWSSIGSGLSTLASTSDKWLPAVASLGGGIASAIGATSAAGTQSDAADRALALSQNNLLLTRSDLAPWRAAGSNALTDLQLALPGLTSPITFDQATLEATPGYKFTRDQGLKSVQNAAAARGLGVSGAALKGAANFATGLADNTVQQNFNRELASRQNAYNMLSGVSNTGENAAAMTGNLGAANTSTGINALTAGANASAAGTVGATNALAGGLNTGVNNYLQYGLLTKLLAQNGGGSSAYDPAYNRQTGSYNPSGY